MLKQWLEKPLINLSDILERQRKVESLVNHYFERMDINDALTSVYDLERLVARVSLGNINGRDLIQLKTSLQQIPGLVSKPSLQSMNRMFGRLSSTNWKLTQKSSN